MARGVCEPIARAFGEVIITLRATSRQLRGACGSPAVRRECAKTKNAAEGVEISRRTLSQDALRRQSNASLCLRGRERFKRKSCKDRSLLTRTSVLCTYTSSGSDTLSRSSVKVVRGRVSCRNLCMEAHDRQYGRNT